MDVVLTQGVVHDGLGSPARRRSIGIDRGRIVIDANPVDHPDAREIRLDGRLLAPGFVDIHTHSDLTLLADPGCPSKVHQGVTTEVVGNCGLGVAPVLADGAMARPEQIRAAVGYLDLDPGLAVGWRDLAGYAQAVGLARPAVNVASFIPHLPAHASAIGLADDPPTPRQLARLGTLLDEGCRQGAVGLSTGLVYAPLCYVGRDELMLMGEVAAHHDVLFAWHVRDYGDELLASVGLAVDVARQTGCRTQISHLCAVGRRNWGRVRQALAVLDEALADGVDIAADIYPYLAGNAPLSQLLPDWAQDGGETAFMPRLGDQAVRGRIAEEWRAAPWVWEDIVVNAFGGVHAPSQVAAARLIGRTIADLAQVQGAPPAEVAMDLLAQFGAGVFMVAYGRSEEDLRAVLNHPATVVASDGQALDPVGVTGRAGRPHPRSYGCFPRYLSEYSGGLTLDDSHGVAAEAIRRCTSGPADRVGLRDRGRIIDGAPADLVVLDPSTVRDTATFDEPQRLARGVELVFVGGELVLEHGQATGARPGRFLTHHTSQSPDRSKS